MGLYSKYENYFSRDVPMKDIKKEKRWVVWHAEKVGGRMTKVPYSITGARASSTDPATWTTYAKAKKASEFFSGIGVIFTPDETLLGIDIDHVLLESGEISHEQGEAIKTLIKEAKTYTEISPSGTGLHLYLALTKGLTLEANRHAPFEAYTSGRFFTFTENKYGKVQRPIRTVSPGQALSLLKGIGYPWGKEETPAPAPMTAAQLLEAPLFTDEELLNRMFASKNGSAIQALYNGDIKEYGKDASRADAALLSHLAFWSRKDAATMERLWLASPLGAREKTKARADYRIRSINGAIKSCKETYSPPQDPSQGIDFLFTLNAQKDKVYTQNTENVCRILREHEDFKDRFRFDEFTQTLETRDTTSSPWRAFKDGDAITIQTKISIMFTFLRKVGKDMVFDAIIKVSEENMIDSARLHLTSLVWDSKPRLDQWLTNTFGTPDDEYHRAVASNWMKGMIKRLMVPGCKFDYVLVLEGEQGAKKSTSLHILGEVNGQNWHVETTMSTDSKDFFMQFSGKAIIEFSEGETLSRTEVKKMKAIITMQSDKYRPPYGRVSVDFPRRCVFAMTTNQEQYLKDETGNRRWLPVTVLKDEADIEWLQENRDQLFAEAYHRAITLNETLYEFPKEATRAQQDARRVSDPNEERIADWYYNDPFLNDHIRDVDGITCQMVYQHALSGFGSMKKFEEMAIANTLESMGLIKTRRRVNAVQSIRWFPPLSKMQQENLLSAPPAVVQAAAEAGEFADEDLPFGQK